MTSLAWQRLGVKKEAADNTRKRLKPGVTSIKLSSPALNLVRGLNPGVKTRYYLVNVVCIHG